MRRSGLCGLLLVVAGEPPVAGRNIGGPLRCKVSLVDRDAPLSRLGAAVSAKVAQQVGVLLSVMMKELPAPDTLEHINHVEYIGAFQGAARGRIEAFHVCTHVSEDGDAVFQGMLVVVFGERMLSGYLLRKAFDWRRYRV